MCGFSIYYKAGVMLLAGIPNVKNKNQLFECKVFVDSLDFHLIFVQSTIDRIFI